jgi:hypothetical protein
VLLVVLLWHHTVIHTIMTDLIITMVEDTIMVVITVMGITTTVDTDIDMVTTTTMATDIIMEEDIEPKLVIMDTTEIEANTITVIDIVTDLAITIETIAETEIETIIITEMVVEIVITIETITEEINTTEIITIQEIDHIVEVDHALRLDNTDSCLQKEDAKTSSFCYVSPLQFPKFFLPSIHQMFQEYNPS